MPEYISTIGRQRLIDELTHLMRVERPGVVSNVSAAAAEGDRSENAEYIYGKKRLRQIDGRIEYLSKRLDKLTPLAKAQSDARVVFLSYVEVEDQDGAVHWFRIVGADETDAKLGHISFKSPVARSLLGREIDDEVNVKTPGGERNYTVLRIRVEPPEAA
ncbi:MAG: transcription elongation factor GreB [Bradymonadia bacterium]|jgi:transcription elongation factor GreB